MSFDEAIQSLTTKYGLDILDNEFLTRSILSDLIGADIYSKRLIDVMFNINEIVNIKEMFLTNSLIDGRQKMSEYYSSVKDKCNRREFVDAINPISKVIRPSEFAHALKEKSKNTTGAKVVLNKPCQVVKNSKITHNINNNNQQVILTKTYSKQPNKNGWSLAPNEVMVNNVSLNDIKAISIKAKNVNLDIRLVDKDKYEPLKFGKNLLHNEYRDIKGTLINGVLDIDVSNKHPQTLRVNIYDKGYDYIKITGSKLNISMHQDYINTSVPKRTLNNLIIDTTVSKICLGDLNVNDLKINNTNQTVSVEGRYNNIDVTNNNGLTAYTLRVDNLKEITLKSHTKKGDILIDFAKGRVFPKVNKHFIKQTNINTISYVNRCKINFDLVTTKGRIRVD